MFKQLRTYLAHLRKGPIPAYRPINRASACRLVMTEASVSAIRDCLASEIAKGHEGISYLFGLTNGATTIVVGQPVPTRGRRPEVLTLRLSPWRASYGAATDAGLQIIGQIHTHPGKAYHSDGDNAGARIAYDGYVSIVVPEYGRRLPSLGGAAIYFYRGGAFSAIERQGGQNHYPEGFRLCPPAPGAERNDRSLRYARRVLPEDRPILIKVGVGSVARYDGQIAATVAANLFARMTPTLAFDVPEADILSPLPWRGTKLHDHLLSTAFAADPSGHFELRKPRDGDYVLSLGRDHSAATVHGSGWNAFVRARRVTDTRQ